MKIWNFQKWGVTQNKAVVFEIEWGVLTPLWTMDQQVKLCLSKTLDVLSATRPVKSPWNSIWYNCQKICSSLRRSKAIWKIREKALFLRVINNRIIYKFFKDFANHTSKTVVLSYRLFPNILKYRDHLWDLPKIWKTRPFQTHIEEFS